MVDVADLAAPQSPTEGAEENAAAAGEQQSPLTAENLRKRDSLMMLDEEAKKLVQD